MEIGNPQVDVVITPDHNPNSGVDNEVLETVNVGVGYDFDFADASGMSGGLLCVWDLAPFLANTLHRIQTSFSLGAQSKVMMLP
ncbi:hypothetical protein L1987_37135 [Smallanthus sonchifolius]|uniref:Uncharacterized protein n=1 Tax=Smallanthus sonchifolius TaxID=185202 RepID=A0ACB9HGE2_9ASTR|nr:hypothetical protein L1987_37135 [Smallanthus sonchifolius]